MMRSFFAHMRNALSSCVRVAAFDMSRAYVALLLPHARYAVISRPRQLLNIHRNRNRQQWGVIMSAKGRHCNVVGVGITATPTDHYCFSRSFIRCWRIRGCAIARSLWSAVMFARSPRDIFGRRHATPSVIRVVRQRDMRILFHFGPGCSFTMMPACLRDGEPMHTADITFRRRRNITRLIRYYG